MSDLRVDTTALIETGRALRVVATEFEHAHANGDRAAETVGDDGLAERVTRFARDGDDRRSATLTAIVALAESAVATGVAFESLEADLVGALKGEE